MNGKFHRTVGIVASVVICNIAHIEVGGVASSILPISAGSVNFSSYADIVIIATMASTAPDLDLKVPFLKHRTWTHGILALLISTLLILRLGNNIYWVWFISYAAHIIADSFTRMGVPFLYPFVKKRYGLKIL